MQKPDSPCRDPGDAMNFNAPHLDYAGLSPVIALTAGICVVLLTAVFERHQAGGARRLTLLTLAAAAGLLIWQWGGSKDLVDRARCASTTWRSRSR